MLEHDTLGLILFAIFLVVNSACLLHLIFPLKKVVRNWEFKRCGACMDKFKLAKGCKK